MISVVVPTLWKNSESFLNFLEKIVGVDCVGEVLIINNKVENTPTEQILNHPKVKLLNQERNIYVVPAWNLGAKEAMYDIISIIEDDIEFDLRLFSKINDFITPDVGMVNLLFQYPDKKEYHERFTDGSIDIIPYSNGIQMDGFGACFFLHKTRWVDIPRIKIWCGEGVIFDLQRVLYKKQNYVAVNCTAFSPWHVSSNNLPEEENIDAVTFEIDNAHFKDLVGLLYKWGNEE